MSKVQPRTLSGFLELLPGRQAQFERMAAIIRESYALYGFTPLDTPLIDCNRIQRGAVSQGRRRDGEADLPFHQGGQRFIPAL